MTTSRQKDAQMKSQHENRISNCYLGTGGGKKGSKGWLVKKGWKSNSRNFILEKMQGGQQAKSVHFPQGLE